MYGNVLRGGGGRGTEIEDNKMQYNFASYRRHWEDIAALLKALGIHFFIQRTEVLIYVQFSKNSRLKVTTAQILELLLL